MNQTLKTVAAIAIVAVLVATVAIVAANYLITSNNVEVNVTSQATLALIADASTVTVGEDILLTATLSDAMGGVPVQFQLNGGNIGSPVNTNISGVATYTYTTTSTGLHNFTAVADHP